MVIPLGPGKFYGSSLPRPRIYTDVKLNDGRVDPPLPVMDPLLSWAQEAHWSMGGLSFKRLRLQGRIEGNVDKLRKVREKMAKLESAKQRERKPVSENPAGDKKARHGSVSPPGAPKVEKRKRRYVGLVDEDEEEVGVEERKGPARKLVGEFDRVAKESGGAVVGMRTSRKGVEDVVMKVVEAVNIEEGLFKGKKVGKKSKKSAGSSPGGVRTSPRLANQRS